MKIARLFEYTLDLEDEYAEGLALAAAADSRNEVLTEQLAAERERHAFEVKNLYREIRSLRRTNANLVDRRAIREGIIPPTESLTRTPPTAEEAAATSKVVQSKRTSGPVAQTRSTAEAEYLANPEAYAEAHPEGK